jgi:hypothetical protein
MLKRGLKKSSRQGMPCLYRNAVDKPFLTAKVAVNPYINHGFWVMLGSDGEKRSLLRQMEREDLRALYSDMMRTLQDEAFYEEVYNPKG